jgi:hypothetical protein
MRRLDWDRNTLQPGDSVTVTANPSRREGARSGYLVNIESPQKAYPSLRGKPAITKLTEGAVESDETAQGIEGVWTTLFNSEFFDMVYADDAELPLTERGQLSKDSFDETKDSPALECIPAVAPTMMLTPDIKLITVSENEIRIRAEFDNAERIIYLDPESTADRPTLHGHSVGAWEDGVLTVTTDNFGPHRMGTTFAVESSPKKRLTETFRLNEDGKGLTYSFVMEDPLILTEPMSAEFQYVYRPDIEYESLPCDLENSRQFLRD